MENKMIPQSESCLGFFGVIRESFKTTIRNGKLLVPVLLFVFLSFSQLDFLQDYMLTPFTNYLMWHLAHHPNIVHDIAYSINLTSYVGVFSAIREILILKLLITKSIITLYFLVITVSSSSEAYTAKLVSGPIDIFLKISKSWKRLLVTTFYLILLTLGITFFYAIFIVITAFVAANSWPLVFLGVITLSITVCYFYVASLWMVSLIVSVLEDGFSGLKAIERAEELMKGKRLQASLMMVLFTLGYGFVFLITTVLTSYCRGLSAELAITILFTNGLYCALKLFMFVVYTVLYHEWKTSHDEEEGKGFYLPIANGEV